MGNLETLLEPLVKPARVEVSDVLEQDGSQVTFPVCSRSSLERSCSQALTARARVGRMRACLGATKSHLAFGFVGSFTLARWCEVCEVIVM